MASIPLAFILHATYIVIYVFILATFTSTLAVTVRRLHGTGRSAWWSLGFVLSAIYDLAGLVDVPGFNTFMLPVSIVLIADGDYGAPQQ